MAAERTVQGAFSAACIRCRPMSAKAVVVVLVAAAVFFCGIVAMHGKGHRMLAKWIPAIHGGGGH